MPRPFAAFAPDAITLGSASKSFWGGLRLGWIRAPHARDGAAAPRPGSRLDLGAPVMEQLVLARLLADAGRRCWPSTGPGCASSATALVGGGREPAARRGASGCPAGGLALWCELPGPRGDRAGRRGRAARRDRRARPGVRRRGRPRPLRADPVDPPRRRARGGRAPPGRAPGTPSGTAAGPATRGPGRVMVA